MTILKRTKRSSALSTLILGFSLFCIILTQDCRAIDLKDLIHLPLNENLASELLRHFPSEFGKKNSDGTFYYNQETRKLLFQRWDKAMAILDAQVEKQFKTELGGVVLYSQLDNYIEIYKDALSAKYPNDQGVPTKFDQAALSRRLGLLLRLKANFIAARQKTRGTKGTKGEEKKYLDESIVEFKKAIRELDEEFNKEAHKLATQGRLDSKTSRKLARNTVEIQQLCADTELQVIDQTPNDISSLLALKMNLQKVLQKYSQSGSAAPSTAKVPQSELKPLHEIMKSVDTRILRILPESFLHPVGSPDPVPQFQSPTPPVRYTPNFAHEVLRIPPMPSKKTHCPKERTFGCTIQ